MTVEQVAVLFRVLKEFGLIKGKDRDIAHFIVEHFETSGKAGKKISAANLVKLFSTKDPNVINFWTAKFIDMQGHMKRK